MKLDTSQVHSEATEAPSEAVRRAFLRDRHMKTPQTHVLFGSKKTLRMNFKVCFSV